MKKLILIFLLILSLNAFGQDAKSVFDKSVNAVGLITDGTGLASGFFIGKNIFVTNYHVAANLDISSSYIRLNNGETIAIKNLIAKDREKDIAVIETLNDSPAILPLSAGGIISKGEKVYAIGNPSSNMKIFEFNITEGIINNITSDEYKTTEGRIYAKVILHSASLNPGNSGGPLLTNDCAVVGVNSFFSAYGNNLYFAIHVEELKNVLKRYNIQYETAGAAPESEKGNNNIFLYLIIIVIVVAAGTVITILYLNKLSGKNSEVRQKQSPPMPINPVLTRENQKQEYNRESKNLPGRIVYNGKVFEILKSEFYVGREAGNDIVLYDQSASRRHFLIKYDGVNYYISDLNSKNGTKVNDNRVSVSLLKSNDRIKAGASDLIFLKG